ncbi:hypothetical protein D3C81_709500 [compost metagenome]
MPASLLVNLGAQTQRTSGGVCDVAAVGGGVPVNKVWPDQHQFALAEACAVLDGVGDGFAAVSADITKGTQLLADTGQCGCYLQVVVAWYTQDTWLHTQFGLCRQQGFHTGVFTVFIGTANDIGGGFSLVFAFCHTYHDGDRFGLLGNRQQRACQGTIFAGLATGGQNVSDQHRSVEREQACIGIFCSTNHANNRRRDGGNYAGAFIDFEDTHAVVIITHSITPFVVGNNRMPFAMGPRISLGMYENWYNSRKIKIKKTPRAGR